MSTEYDMDVLIVGAGTAAQTAAYDLIAEGYDVTVVEKSNAPGGVCALHGCQAKKYFYELTELMAKSKHLLGAGVESVPQISWFQTLQAKNQFTSAVPENTVQNLKGNGIQYLQGSAIFVDDERIQIGDKIYHPRFIVLASGAKPMDLPINGADLLKSSNYFLDMVQLAKKIVFVGGGFISFEFAHFAARLGAEDVTILEVMDRPLGPFDEDMVQQLVIASAAEGIRVKTGIKIEKIVQNGADYTVLLGSGEQLSADLVVHGAGRIADIEDLNLSVANIQTNGRGIEVDGQMQTSNNKVYAIGDCAATLQLARVADMEGHKAAASIVAQDSSEQVETMEYGMVPAVLFTYPQLAMVGKTEEELVQDGLKYWKSSDKDLSWPTYKRIGMKHAAYKILVDNDSKFLGAHFISDNATGLVNCLKQAMLDGMTVQELYQANIMSPYPSRESDLIYMLEPLLD